MVKWIRRIIVILLVAVFAFSVTYIVVTYLEYRKNDMLYEDMAERFIGAAPAGAQEREKSAGSGGTVDDAGKTGDTAGEKERLTAPVTVDFQGLKEVNEDIIGWLYCEGTPINYPVLQGEDNDQYLRHSYDGSYNMAGSIFVEELNRSDFQDYNTIIYGHHMKNGSMFAALQKWQDQAFYEEHPVMWLLTPERDYRIDLFSAYTTSAYAETYTVFQGPGEEFEQYLEKCAGQSEVCSDVELDSQGRYVLLSTCAYAFEDARHVLHGRLIPADSAGGRIARIDKTRNRAHARGQRRWNVKMAAGNVGPVLIPADSAENPHSGTVTEAMESAQDCLA